MGTLAEYALAALQEVVDLVFGVDDGELAQVLDAFQPLLLYFCDVVFESERLQDGLMASLGSSVLLFKVLQNVAHAKSYTAHLVGIGGADALAGGAYFVLAFLGFVGCIKHTVGGHDEVSFLRDVQAVLQFMATLLKSLCLLHEEVGSQHHTVADDIDLLTLENA